MKIAIITAMASEFASVKSLYDFKGNDTEETAVAHGKEILLIKSGMGKVNAAVAAMEAINKGADIIINTGLAGGIDGSLNQCDIVLANKVCYHDVWCGEPNKVGQMQDLPLYYETSPALLKQIEKSAPHFKVGLAVTGDQFLTDVERLKEIKSTFPEALAVDMESAAIGQVAFLMHKQFISLRIISDVVGKEGQLESYEKFKQDTPKTAAEMVDIALSAIKG
jgi:adenosylhomocysteine nucleosidase